MKSTTAPGISIADNGGNTQPVFQASREDALSGLSLIDSQYGVPLDKNVLAGALIANRIADDNVLGEEFLRYLGATSAARTFTTNMLAAPNSPAVQVSSGTASPPTPPAAVETPAGTLGGLLRGFLTSLLGKGNTAQSPEIPEFNTMPVKDKKPGKHGHHHGQHHLKPGEFNTMPVDEKKSDKHGKHPLKPGEFNIMPIDEKDGSDCAKAPSPKAHHGQCAPETTHTTKSTTSSLVTHSLAAGGKSSTLSDSAPPAVRRFKAAIENASRATGIAANMIAAQIWAESRGNPNEKSTNPEDHLPDVGLMQISQHTYDSYVRAADHSLPKLDVYDPAQNILAGAYEVRQHIHDHGGNLAKGLNAYVGEGINDHYVKDVMGFYNDMNAGRTPKD